MKFEKPQGINQSVQSCVSDDCADAGSRTPWVLRVGQGINQSDVGESWNPRLD